MNQNKIKNIFRCNKNIRHVLVWVITRKFCPYNVDNQKALGFNRRDEWQIL